eukprot:GSMAST32.ASY1.ANO1.2441.1 assembled CDS
MSLANDPTLKLDELLLPLEVLNSSPSSKDEIAVETETKHRAFCCELIQEAGILLRMPQVVMATGQTLAQRFYYRQSLLKFDALEVAMARRFLLRQLLKVFNWMYYHRKNLPQQQMELGGMRYTKWKNAVLKTERYILKDLGFSLYTIMEHPHKFILYYVKCLDGSHELAQKAWNYLNDSLRFDFCVRYRAQVIACAAIFLAARFLQQKLPLDPPWYKLFDASESDIIAISNKLLASFSYENKSSTTDLSKKNLNSQRWIISLKTNTSVSLANVGATKRQNERRYEPNKAIVLDMPKPYNPNTMRTTKQSDTSSMVAAKAAAARIAAKQINLNLSKYVSDSNSRDDSKSNDRDTAIRSQSSNSNTSHKRYSSTSGRHSRKRGKYEEP